jgi:hypothetical protein
MTPKANRRMADPSTAHRANVTAAVELSVTGLTKPNPHFRQVAGGHDGMNDHGPPSMACMPVKPPSASLLPPATKELTGSLVCSRVSAGPECRIARKS